MNDVEYKKACQERNDWFMKVNGRPMTFDDMVKSWGGRAVGESQVDPNWRGIRSAADDGVLHDT